MQKSVKDIKGEIQQLTAANTIIVERIKDVKEEYEVGIDAESDSETDLSLPQAEAKLIYKKHFQNKVHHLKLNKCDYVGRNWIVYEKTS